MATTLPPLADDDLGTDVALTDDLAAVWGIASGKANLAAALYRRLTTTRGTLFYEPGYGFNITDLLNAELDAAALSAARGSINAECEKDERVQTATTSLTFAPALKALDIEVEVETADGPFDLVLRVTESTVEILRLGGQDVLPIPARPDAVVVVVERGGGAGGGGGSGGTGLTFLTGIRLWLEADYGTAVNGSNEMLAWADRSGHNNDASAWPTSAAPVKFVLDPATTENGMPALVSSVGSSMESSSAADPFPTPGEPRTIFVVAKVDVADSGCIFLSSKQSSTVFSVGLWNFGNNGTIYPYTDGVTISQSTPSAPAIFPGAVKIFKYRFSGSGQIEFGVNDGPWTALTGGAWSSESGSPGYDIGAFQGTTFQGSLKGKLYGILGYAGAIADGDAVTVVDYLTAKYL